MTPSNEAVEAAARAMASADGLDWDEPCGVDGEEGFCDSGTCISAHYEDHDAEQARRWYLHVTTAALTAALPLIRAQVLEEAAKVCLDQRDVYLSPQYATGQPLSSIMERMACTTCAGVIRALKESHP